jgi:4-hydroxy-tetrahydrodipicolinate synthase
MNVTQDYLYNMYRQVIEASPCDVGIYHRNTPTAPNGETLARLAELPKVIILKDSSGNLDDEKSILSTRDRLRATKDFYAYCGAEFDCPKAIQAGYDGMMIGGACFNGRMAGKIVELTRKGQLDEAKSLQLRMNNLMYDVFGGKDLHCWLAGQKQLLVELGIFTTNKCVMNYHLDKETAENIKIAVKREEEFL